MTFTKFSLPAMNDLNGFLLSLLISFTYSCQNSSLKKSEDIISIDIDTIIQDSPISFSDIFSNFQIIPLESNEICQFNYIRDIKIMDSVIYVYDGSATKSVYLFSIDGTYLSKVYKIGRGPGEYINPTDFDIDRTSGTILIYDWASKKMNEYDRQGNCIAVVSIANRFMSFTLDNDRLITYRPYPENPENLDENLLNIFDRKGNFISSHFNYQSILKGPKLLEFRFGGYFFKTKNDIKFFPNYHNTIYSIKKESFKPFLVLNSKKYELTQTDLDNLDLDRPSDRFNAMNRTEKFLKVQQYSDNNEIAHFVIDIGMRQYHTFYNFKTKEIRCSNRLNDDLTYISPNLCSIEENQFISYVEPMRIAKFLELIKSNKIKLSGEQKKRLENITDFSNPIIIIYDLK